MSEDYMPQHVHRMRRRAEDAKAVRDTAKRDAEDAEQTYTRVKYEYQAERASAGLGPDPAFV